MPNGRQLRCDFSEIAFHTKEKASTELLVILGGIKEWNI